jgi:hypothetical protein
MAKKLCTTAITLSALVKFEPWLEWSGALNSCSKILMGMTCMDGFWSQGRGTAWSSVWTRDPNILGLIPVVDYLAFDLWQVTLLCLVLET